MSDLVPCPACDRHVRKHESACPFCSVELSLQHLPPAALPRSRLGRAATFAFGATLAGAALVACGGESEQGKKGGGGGSAGGSATGGNATGGSNAAAGNAMGGSNAAAGNAMGGNNAAAGNAMGGNVAQPYGVPPLGGSGQVPPYGTPPSEGGGTPIYGAAPAD